MKSNKACYDRETVLRFGTILCIVTRILYFDFREFFSNKYFFIFMKLEQFYTFGISVQPYIKLGFSQK
jgi:hypothetical protein